MCLSRGLNPELHWFPEDISSARLAVTLAGMANTKGGTVLLGISPRGGEVHGIHDPDAVLDRIFQAVLLTEPPLVIPIPKIVPLEKSQVMVITVPPGLPNVYNVEGRYWGREGKQTTPLPARRLRQLLIERGVVQFELQVPPQSTLDDLDIGLINKYLAVAGLPGYHDGKGLAWQDALFMRGALQRSPSQLAPTYAALLMFGHAPQQWLPGATILAARFSGTTFSDEFISQEIRGSLPEQLQQAEKFLRTNLRSIVRMTGMTHIDTLEYPFEAVRELIVNAVAHRDYNAQGDVIHLNLFADRLEVQSPGRLPGPVNLDNLLDARFARNAVITQILADLGYVERLGYGLDRVVASMSQNGLRPPKFEEVAGSFRVTLFNDLNYRENNKIFAGLSKYQSLGLNPRQLKALVFLAQHSRISNRDYQDLCPEVHVETLRRDFADLVSRGILIKIGDKRATYYIYKKKPKSEAG